MRAAFALSAGFLAVLTSGCGTVCNLASNNPQPYGGIARDVEWVSKNFRFSGKENAGGAALAVGAVATEMGLTGLADTLTWPLVASLHTQRSEQEMAILNDPAMQVQFSCGAAVTPLPSASLGLPEAIPDASAESETPSRRPCAPSSPPRPCYAEEPLTQRSLDSPKATSKESP
jgi:hypothetical protein